MSGGWGNLTVRLAGIVQAAASVGDAPPSIWRAHGPVKKANGQGYPPGFRPVARKLGLATAATRFPTVCSVQSPATPLVSLHHHARRHSTHDRLCYDSRRFARKANAIATNTPTPTSTPTPTNTPLPPATIGVYNTGGFFLHFYVSYNLPGVPLQSLYSGVFNINQGVTLTIPGNATNVGVLIQVYTGITGWQTACSRAYAQATSVVIIVSGTSFFATCTGG